MNKGYPQCAEFLQWALPRLGLRWKGFRKVRGQVCKRVRRRLGELGLSDLGAYRAYLECHPEEWTVLEGLTHITMSRFHRDRGAFASLRDEVLPALARGAQARGSDAIEVWSAGCASGEEPYTLAIMWALGVGGDFPGVGIRILATDVDDAMLARARDGCYGASSLRELPESWRATAFMERGGEHRVLDGFRAAVTFARHDILDSAPPTALFDLVMCRNLAFTYFDDAGQRAVAARIAGALRPGGALAVGKHEALPAGVEGFAAWSAAERIYRRL
jgi:chemotaxis protein methyltransferase CheR